MKKQPNTVIIIPAYNESIIISEVIKTAAHAAKAQNISVDILVVNDKSTDDTSAKAQKAGAIVIDHIINRGVGGATSTGLKYAKQKNYHQAATMDADGQHDPQDVMNCLKQIKVAKADLLIGSRLSNKHGMSLVKRIGNNGLSFITWLLFGVKVSDSQSGLRVFSRKAIQTLDWQSAGYEFCSEQLWRAKQAKLVVAEYPVKAIYTKYSKSKGQNNWNGVNIVKSLIKMKIKEILG
ncbi:MAG: glycosyltransferase family 2 protein [Candidatus Nomurabacteria bacterium]|jgi:glycosyltransferase involved in cell wall biosynthesis|nr:glycosyltransferase family 2 protein [Candidatus Nomurabacteria bacterium]